MRRQFLCITLILMSAGAGTATGAESASMMLERGIHLEETVGDLDKAIEVYRQIVADAETNRRYAAQAQLRLGLCLLKKNQEAEAREALEKLIADYPEQRALVTRARKSLPSRPFPEIEGCRLKERVAVRLEPPAAGCPEPEPSVSVTVPEYTIIDVHWSLDKALAAKTKCFAVLQVGYSARWASLWAHGDDRSMVFGEPDPGVVSTYPVGLTAGEYKICVKAYALDYETARAKDEMPCPLAVGAVRIVVEPVPYTQISISDIQPDGTIRFRTIIQKLNDGISEQATETFVNSDFVRLEKITDDNGEPLEFTSQHSRDRYRYSVKLNRPVAPGRAMIYASEGEVKGMIKPVAGQADTFRYHMQHWPGVHQPTRRIEIYRLPKGAELLETKPPDVARREVLGRTEVCFREMIPAQGSITTTFSYRLAGAKLTATQPGAGTEALELTPAPWTDGERQTMRISTKVGMEVGQVVYMARSAKVANKDAWRIESVMVVPIQDMEQYTRVDAERESFAPISGRTDNTMLGDFRAEYGDRRVKLVVSAQGKETTREIDLKGTAYDNEQALYVIRRMPLADGYSGVFPIFPVMGGGVIDCRIEVKARETVAVPAGSYECYRLDLSVYSDELRVLQHELWFSADKHQYLVKYDSGAAVMELTDVSVVSKDKPPVFQDKDLQIRLALPVDWCFYKTPLPPDPYDLSLQFLPPEMKAWAALTVQDRGESATPRYVAQEDIKKLKGFFKDYTVREDTWRDLKVGGLPAVQYAADYQEKDKAKVEYRTYILGESKVYWFVWRIEKDQFDAMRPEFDAVMKGFEVAANKEAK